MGVYGRRTTVLNYPAGKAVVRENRGKICGKNSDYRPVLAIKPNTHRQTPPYSSSQAGQCLDNLLTPSGRRLSWASCQQLPVHWVPGWASLGGRIGHRNSPPLTTPRPQSETAAQGLASLSLGRQFVLCTPQLTLQLEPWPGGQQLRHPPRWLRGPGRGRPFLALQRPATSSSQCGAAFLGL